MSTTKLIAKVALAVSAVCAAVTASAFYDTDILIQRALNSPDFHVKYSGVAASMIEMRVNGSSMGTQAVSASKSAGEVIFTLDLLSLNDGENQVEVRLFDKSGKLLGTQKMSVSTDDGSPSPVKLTGPKMGATVQGTFEIKVGFGKEMRNAYVSFFVDDQFKSMSNSTPFNYFWDSSIESNGWHELQAWVVDENSITHKTRKLRVFVNNPSGRTVRRNPAPATTPIKPITVPAAKVQNTVPTASAIKPAVIVPKTVATTKLPTAPIELSMAMNSFKAVTSSSVGLKSAQPTQSATASARMVSPKSLPTKLTSVSAPTVSNVYTATTAASRLSIGYGTKVPATGNFKISVNAKAVKFDVQPRIQDGVPLTPLRHLLEANGGKVDWEALTKTVFGKNVDGATIMVKIGDRMASINDKSIDLEMVPFLEGGRTIVPLSFIRDALQVDVEFDVKTGHVLITAIKKK